MQDTGGRCPRIVFRHPGQIVVDAGYDLVPVVVGSVLRSIRVEEARLAVDNTYRRRPLYERLPDRQQPASRSDNPSDIGNERLSSFRSPWASCGGFSVDRQRIIGIVQAVFAGSLALIVRSWISDRESDRYEAARKCRGRQVQRCVGRQDGS